MLCIYDTVSTIIYHLSLSSTYGKTVIIGRTYFYVDHIWYPPDLFSEYHQIQKLFFASNWMDHVRYVTRCQRVIGPARYQNISQLVRCFAYKICVFSIYVLSRSVLWGNLNWSGNQYLLKCFEVLKLIADDIVNKWHLLKPGKGSSCFWWAYDLLLEFIEEFSKLSGLIAKHSRINVSDLTQQRWLLVVYPLVI